MRLILLLAIACMSLQTAIAQDSSENVYMSESYVACLDPTPGAPTVNRFGPDPNLDESRFRQLDRDQSRFRELDPGQQLSMRYAGETIRNIFRSFGEYLCNGTTPEHINSNIPLPGQQF